MNNIDAFKDALEEADTIRRRNDTPLSVDLWTLLENWLISHIMCYDKKYAPLESSQ
ncbi:MAG: hypothetical protein GY941_14140 [Planctomycetes bacterium]|nr:hypothetical protein [Planctomycetota bacterium]